MAPDFCGWLMLRSVIVKTALKCQIDEFLHNLRASQHADIYLAALNQLLLEIEHQRDELAAIWRKGLGLDHATAAAEISPVSVRASAAGSNHC